MIYIIWETKKYNDNCSNIKVKPLLIILIPMMRGAHIVFGVATSSIVILIGTYGPLVRAFFM